MKKSEKHCCNKRRSERERERERGFLFQLFNNTIQHKTLFFCVDPTQHNRSQSNLRQSSSGQHQSPTKGIRNICLCWTQVKWRTLRMLKSN